MIVGMHCGVKLFISGHREGRKVGEERERERERQERKSKS
jgi:hypothetical protein